MKTYNIKCTTYDCRYLYIYKNGNVYCALTEKADRGFYHGDKVILQYDNAVLKGKFVCYKKNGIVVEKWKISRK